MKRYRFDISIMVGMEFPELITHFYANIPYDLCLGFTIDIEKYMGEDGMDMVKKAILEKGVESMKGIGDPQVVSLRLTKEFAQPIVYSQLIYKFSAG